LAEADEAQLAELRRRIAEQRSAPQRGRHETIQ
jgi:hypothetical protein